VSVRDAEATGCCTNPVISSIPKWHRPRLIRAVTQCIGQIPIGTGWIHTGWDEPEPEHRPSEERRRVDVVAVEPSREVERAVGDGDHVTTSDRGAPTNQESADESVGGAEPTRMIEADEQRPGDRPRERDDAIGGRTHEITGAGVVFDTPIARAVGAVGKTERVEHRSVGRGRQEDARSPRWCRRRQDDRKCQDEYSDEGHTTPLVGSRGSGMRAAVSPTAGAVRRVRARWR
jgi:hypothetical protein